MERLSGMEDGGDWDLHLDEVFGWQPRDIPVELLLGLL
jgi:hypothetical protein